MSKSKSLFLLALILFLCTPVLSQDRTILPDDNLYSVALAASMDKMEQAWSHIDDSNCGFDCDRIRTNYRRVIVEKNPGITDNLPTQFGAHRVEYLDSEGLIDRYKKLRKEFTILRVNRIVYEDGHFEITIGQPWFSYKKRVSYYAISDWSTVLFRYDCNEKAFVIDDVKLGGI